MIIETIYRTRIQFSANDKGIVASAAADTWNVLDTTAGCMFEREYMNYYKTVKLTLESFDEDVLTKAYDKIMHVLKQHPLTIEVPNP